MSGLRLDVRLDGFSKPVGELRRDTAGDLSFQYNSSYLNSSISIPLSLSLPLNDEPTSDAQVRSFFDNLLQERDAPLRSVMDRYGIDRSDIAALLLHVGRDCAGAISVLPEGAPPSKVPGDIKSDYDFLSEPKIKAIVAALHDRRPLPDDLRDPSPLAGVQSKISVLYLPESGFALPKPNSGAPTTHILKVPERGRFRDARLEHAAMSLASVCDLKTSEAVVVPFGEIDCLLVERFDRGLDSEGRTIRFHQEDFAQALGLPPSLKYERNGLPGRRFDSQAIRRVLDQTAEPANARRIFAMSTLFDLLIGNTDAHAKNHSLIYGSGLRPKLAPRYDVLPTRLHRQFNEDFSYSIGTAVCFGQVTREELGTFLSDLGLSGRSAQQRLLGEFSRTIPVILAGLLEQIQSEGMKEFTDLIAANMRQLLPSLNLPVPDAALGRDAFIAGGGGWHAS